MAFQENLNASICIFSFFRSHGSNVSHGSGCRAVDTSVVVLFVLCLGV